MTERTLPPAVPPPAWNDTARAYPPTTLHEAFESQVARTPDAPAIRFRDEALSYRELNVRANQLAEHLIELGAGPDILVAICMDRSLEMVIALYATLKSGSAYVPIDPEYPADRVSFMLADTRAPILLTQGALADRFSDTAARTVPVDLASGQLADRAAANPSARATLDDLAYVIYTSGSTGRPKGAMITHRAISNRIHWMQDAYRPDPADRVLQKTPFSFDVSVWEFFWPLMFGARAGDGRARRAPRQRLSRQVIVEQASRRSTSCPRCCSCSSRTRGAGDCASLKRVICSGEALPKALQDGSSCGSTPSCTTSTAPPRLRST